MTYTIRNASSRLNQFAVIMSQVLHVDVEIADSDLFRVAGTGKLKKKINQSMSGEGHAYSLAIKTGRPQIISNPRFDQVCLECSKRLACKETFEISYPIKIQSDVVGIIGLVCYTNQQRMRIQKNLNEYCEFLKKISEFIALDIIGNTHSENQSILINVLNTILSDINIGVLVLDSHNSISMINKKAAVLLDVTNKAAAKISVQNIPNVNGTSSEYIVNMNEDIYHVFGKIFDTGIKENNIILFLYDSRVITTKDASNKYKNILGVNRIIGKSHVIEELKNNISRINYFKINTLLDGEQGVETREAALAVYEESTLSQKKFFELNCASYSAAELERILFGDSKTGLLEKASGHTLWLNNIDALSIETQSKLIDIFETDLFENSKSNKVPLKTRFISSTHKNLSVLIGDGLFKQELYYYLSPYRITIPPLRDRGSDIIRLAKIFLKRSLKHLFDNPFTFDDECRDCLISYSWPGNILELRNSMEKVAIGLPANGIIGIDLLPSHITSCFKIPTTNHTSGPPTEKELINNLLKKYGSSLNGKEQAAEALGMSIATLYRRIKQYEL